MALTFASSVAYADGDMLWADPKTAFSAWTPINQWLVRSQSDPRYQYGYATNAGSIALADELGDRLSELGRVSLIEGCFEYTTDISNGLISWAICGEDVKAVDLKKLEAELDAGGISPKAHAEVLRRVHEIVDGARKIVDEIDNANEPGAAQLTKLVAAAKTEWADYLAKHKADFDRYLALKDGVRSGKTNDPAFTGCYEATQPAFAKLVKAAKLKSVNGDPMPGFVSQLIGSTEGYITTVSYAACAWSIHESGEAIYVAAANGPGGQVRAGWRSIALAKLLDPTLKPKFAQRSLRLNPNSTTWQGGTQLSGVNDIRKIMTPSHGVIAALKVKGDVTGIVFKGNQVEECLQWQETNRVSQVNNGNVSYEKVCKKRGMVANQTTAVEVPSKYL
ncbi:MAG TPA: hypothetical protein VGG28_23460, partial [Kofleriaceae bacterium]